MNLSERDLRTLKEKGITPSQFTEQLEMLSIGFPYLKIEAPATPGHGLFVLSPEMEKQCTEIWKKFLNAGAKIIKMVPASGAASRMFKNLFEFLNNKKEHPGDDFLNKFFDEIENFAFFPRLNFICTSLYGESVDTLIRNKKYKDVVRALLEHGGLNYGQLPKALLEFHKIHGDSRTAFEEHLAEGAQYADAKNGKVNIHFTVSEEHLPLLSIKAEEKTGVLAHKFGKDFNISFSIQKPSTDTVAVTLDGEPYREAGELFFRPGGHGALIENLNDLDADVIFIKNIDNVVPDSKREETIKYKMIIGGVLVAVKQKLDEYCKLIMKGKPSEKQIEEMEKFLKDNLSISHSNIENMNRDEKLGFLFSKFNRPLRVCGMVKNEGEPGGGPFLTYNPDGTVSAQILESTQIDPHDKEAMKMLKESTHFNPVDLVCATKDWEGKKFDLTKYVDKSTGFISRKSRKGVEIKALELPGLWNGAMSDWNTVLVEVPPVTFNPVKTVNDLLREAHQ